MHSQVAIEPVGPDDDAVIPLRYWQQFDLKLPEVQAVTSFLLLLLLLLLRLRLLPLLLSIVVTVSTAAIATATIVVVTARATATHHP